MKTWFVTGASRGFGLKIAQRALAAGDNVVATGRSLEALENTLGFHPNLLTIQLDVTNEDEIRKAVRSAVKFFDRIDVLVNNAGLGLLGAIEESTPEEVEQLYRINVFGLLSVTKAVLPQMRKQRSGHILNISSIAGYRGSAGFGVYSSTKFAVEGLSESLAAEVKPFGIQVTILEPGYFRTDFLDPKSLLVSSSSIDDYTATTGQVRQRAQSVSHQQPGDPDKFAEVVVSIAGNTPAPLRLAVGRDTVEAIQAKNRFVQEELERWHDLSVSTDLTEAR